jgi:hypothetical protein
LNWFQRFKKSTAYTQANIVCTIVIAVATVAYALIARRQLTAMNGQLREMHESVEEAKRSGQQSTDQIWKAIGNINWMARSMDWSQKVAQQGIELSGRQSKQALDASIASSRLDQRAWVGSMQVTGIPEVGKTYDINVVFGNTGKTPALDVITQAREIPVHTGSKFVPAFDKEPTFTQSRTTLFPNQIATSVVKGSKDVAATQSDVDFINQSKEVTIYVIGRVCYKDVFGESHWARFCEIYSPAGKAYISCTEYNEIDKEQTRDKETCILPSPPGYPN